MKVNIYRLSSSIAASKSFKEKYVVEIANKDQFKGFHFLGSTSIKGPSTIFLEFNSKEEAIDFAKSKKYSYSLIDTPSKKFYKKSLSFNFTKDKNLYYY